MKRYSCVTECLYVILIKKTREKYIQNQKPILQIKFNFISSCWYMKLLCIFHVHRFKFERVCYDIFSLCFCVNIFIKTYNSQAFYIIFDYTIFSIYFSGLYVLFLLFFFETFIWNKHIQFITIFKRNDNLTKYILFLCVWHSISIIFTVT